jgi:hypothetical protein
VSEEVEYQTERLDHLGIVAGVCREAGIAAWLDAQAGKNNRDVSVGTAVVAMILNGLGFANRQLYLVQVGASAFRVEQQGLTAKKKRR